jgi:hypothetical protein
LTVKGAVKQKLIVFLAAALLAGVFFLPALIRHDETAVGFTQIILSYTLTLATIILGTVTIWLGCSSISRELEECQMQVLVTKPVARWQIWTGKLLGISVINLILMLFCGVIVYGVLSYKSAELPEDQQQFLREKILVARGSVTEKVPDFQPIIEEEFQTRVREEDIPETEWQAVRQHLRSAIINDYQTVRPGSARLWQLDFSGKQKSLKGRPLFVRLKIQTPDYLQNEEDPNVYPTVWQVGEPTSDGYRVRPMDLPVGVWHEFAIPEDNIQEDGTLYLAVQNMSSTPLFFPVDEPLEVLYRESGFFINYLRGLGILFFWLTLIAILSLTASSFLSFSVASFFCLTALFVFFSRGAVEGVLENNTILGIDYNDSSGPRRYYPIVDAVGLPFFQAMKFGLDLVADFSPIESLSNGRSVTWGQFFKAFFQIVMLIGGIIGLFGITIFQRREIATAQGK